MTKFQKILEQHNRNTPDKASGVSAQKETKFSRILKTTAADVDENTVNQFRSASSNYQSKRTQTYNDLDWQTGSGSDSSLWDNEESKAMTSAAKRVRTWAWANRDQLDPEAFENLTGYVDDFLTYQMDSARDFRMKTEGMKQYKTQEEYDQAVQASEWYRKYQGKNYSQLQSAISQLPDGAEKDWLTSYAPSIKTTYEYSMDELQVQRDLSTLQMLKDEDDNLKKIVTRVATNSEEYQNADRRRNEIATIVRREYGGDNLDALITAKSEELRNSQMAVKITHARNRRGSDFEEKSQYMDTDNWLSQLVNNPAMADKLDTAGTLIKGALHTPGKIGADDAVQVYEDQYYQNLHLMWEEERENFNYLFNTQGEEAAREYLDTLQKSLNARSRAKVSEWVTARTKDNWAAPFYTSLLSTPLKLAGGASTLVDVGEQKLKNALTGSRETVDYNRDAMMLANAGNTIRTSVTQQINDATGTHWLGDAYNLGMSMNDSAVVAIATAINPISGKVASSLLSASAAADTMQAAAANGASDNQAITLGLAAGFFEYFFEKYEIGSLMKNKGGKLGKALIHQAFSEAVGEGATELSNMVMNAWVMAENSDIKKSVQAYLGEHPDWTEDQARAEAMKDAVFQVLKAAVGGALSGGIMGTGAVAVNAGITHHQQTTGMRDAAVDEFYAKKYREDIPGLVRSVLEIDPENQMAKAVQEKLDNREAVTDQELRQLAEPVVAAEMEKTASTRLQELGETGDVAALSKAAVKSATGETLTAQEKAALKGSDYGSQVVSELSKSLKKEGEQAKQWGKETAKDRLKKLKDLEKAMIKHNKAVQKGETDPDTELQDDIDLDETPEETFEVADDGTTVQRSTGRAIKIKDVAFKNGKLTLRTEDGSEVAASDVSYGTEAEALVYEAVAQLDGIIDGKTATRLSTNLIRQINQGDPVSDQYIKAVAEAYRLGYEGSGIEAARAKTSIASELTDRQRNYAYNMGEKYATEVKPTRQDTETKTADNGTKAPDNGTETAKGRKKTDKRSKAPDGKSYDNVQFESKVKQWGEKQRADVEFLDFVARDIAGGVTVHVFESFKGPDGNRYYYDRNGNLQNAPNGRYIHANGDIYLDLNAGDSGEGLVLNTFAHELYHHIERWSPAKARQLAEFLVKEQGLDSVGAMVDAQIEKAEAAGHGVKYFMKQGMSRTAAENTVRARAFSDFVADSLEAVFTKGDALGTLQRLKKSDQGLFDRIKAFVDKWVSKLKKYYQGDHTLSIEGQVTAQLETFEQIQALFLEALVDAGENFRNAEVQNTGTDVEAEIEQFSDRGYSYKALTSKPDMKITTVDGSVRYSRDDIIKKGKKNAASIGQLDPRTGSISVYVDDVGRNVTVGTPGLRHGLEARRTENATVTLKAGEILKNSIRINETVPKKENADSSYVLIGAARDVNGDFYIVRSVVNTFSHELTSMDVLYAINAKKENQLSSMLPGFQGPVTGSTISIAKLLDYVNQYFPDILPEDVLKHYGHSARPEGILGESALYSDRNVTPTSNREILLNTTEDDTQTDWEKKLLQRYKDKAQEIADVEEKLNRTKQLLKELSPDVKYKSKVMSLRADKISMESQLRKLNGELRNMMELKPLQDLLKREKQRVLRTAQQRYKNRLYEQKLSAEVKQSELLREHRETKAALRQQQSDYAIMEDEFIRIVKAYEKLEKAAEKSAAKAAQIPDLKQTLKEEAKKYREDSKTWDAEFRRLLREYEKSGRKIDNLEQKIADQRKAAKDKVESRKRTEMRHQIRRDVKDIYKLYNRGKDTNNVKEEMKEVVFHALSSAELLLDDLYTDDDMIRNGLGIKLSPKENALLTKAKKILYRLDNPPTVSSVAMLDEWNRQEEKLKLELSKTKTQLQEAFLQARRNQKGDILSMVMQDLCDAYKELANSTKPYIRNAFRPFVLMHLEGVRERLKTTSVEDMTLDQLTELHEAYTMVLTSIRDANKAFCANRSIDYIAKQLISDFGGQKLSKSAIRNLARNISDAAGWNYEKLYYALERIGSPTFTQLFVNLANAENIIMEDVADAKAYQIKTVDKYGYNKWSINKMVDREFVDNLGHRLQLTLGEIMLLYAYTRRGNVWKQLEIGGFVLERRGLTDVRNATAYKLTPAQCLSITNTLTEKQKHFVEDMQKYLSDVMGEKGNEVSMKLYGVKLYNDPNYCPIHIAGEYKARAAEAKMKKEAGFESLAHTGFTKTKNIDATATISLESFMDIWVDHVNEMSRYHGAVPALEDIRRVMNYSDHSDSQKDSVAVKAMMENRFGKQAVQYFDDLYREVNSGAVLDKLQALPKKALSISRKLAVAYSLSVLVQQPSSICRAFAMVDPKYFAGMSGAGASVWGVAKTVTNRWSKRQTVAYAEMVKYAPGVTLAKEIGGFDASGGGIRNYLMDTQKSLVVSMKTGTAGEKLQAVGKVIDDNPIANLPNLADKIAWIEIWNACKREVKDKHRSMDWKSEAFMKLVGRRFTEVIRATQVYDSVFAKSPWLKSKNVAVQYLVSYMNEPNVVANMTESAIRDIRKGGGENIRKGARKLFAVTRSIIFCNVLKSLIYAMRDDEEDETYIEKYMQALVSNVIGDFTGFNYIPFVRDIWSVCRGYDVERPDMSIFIDLISSIQKYNKVKNKDTSEMSPEELEEWDSQCTEADWGLIGAIAGCFGIPVKNIYREIDSVFSCVRICGENAGKTTWKTFGDACYQGVMDALPFRDQESKSDKLYEALTEGDTKYLDRLQAGYLNSDGKLKTSYYTALRKGLREHDPRIQTAANARKGMDTDEYLSIIEEIVAEGHFSENDVKAAILSEYNQLKDANSEKLLFEALAYGDKKTAEKLKSNFVNDEGEFSESSYRSAIQKGLRENDPRILQAAEAKLDRDFTAANKLLSQIAEEDHFSRSDISAAITAEYNQLKDD